MPEYKHSHTLLLILLAVAGGLFIFAVAKQDSVSGDYRGAFARNYQIFSPELPDSLNFAGEPVPLDNLLVKESLDREILAFTFMHSSTQQMFKRANRYFPVIEPILKKFNVPDDFKFLAIAESNLQNTTSPAGAEGVWQFLTATARHYGLEVNAQIDERYNLQKATEAACKYLLEARDTFGCWTLAAASYNRGPNGLKRALSNQRVTGYYDLYLNEETARYVFRILAAKEIYNHPVRYGFYMHEADFYPPIPTYTLRVDTTIKDLPAFALSMGYTYTELREFNPWLPDYTLPNKSGRTYLLTFPKTEYLKTATHRNREIPETFFNDTLKIKEIY